ncbi:hypothetical protein A2997_00060 [Candidatus Nomurabacteria bacterium RIFCSPLOWO2_01_FULL_36_10b]|uniref:Uncharacterized protein n=1 Tax=Candidatus Nomurabacteria bacterium RIFCSPLOWO2_01_FULL_36_10b TaxID=1801766 RepID=A0A1F6WPX5_9BACT|nr:MAG: hypothetical protein A2997_00060 [Candidatus Nomurabacteria bacterium RIFCSPLOWO2_01_FULL_36_10b]
MVSSYLKLFLILTLVFITSVIVSQRPIYAQQIIGPNDVSLILSPELPGSYQIVTANLESYVINLDSSDITWFINDVEKLKGIGKKSFQFETEGSNSPLDIQIKIAWTDSDYITKKIRIQPANLDILWQAVDSYTPPFYKGKALPSSESVVLFVAVPQRQSGNSEYVYTWRRNGDVVQEASGYNKNSFLLENSYFRDIFDAGVDVSSRDGTYNAEQRITIPRFDTVIRFALEEVGSLFIYPDSSPAIKTHQSSSLLHVYPYFFSSSDGVSDLIYNWTIDSEPYEPGKANELPIITPTGETGSSIIDVTVRHMNNILQDNNAYIRIDF